MSDGSSVPAIGADPAPRYRHATGLPALDAAVYSAPVVPVQGKALLREGLALAVIPAQPAQLVEAPGPSADVLIGLLDPIRRFERDPAPELCLPGRTAGLPAGSLIAIPENLATEWHLPDGQPRVLHLHLGADLRETLAEGPRGRAPRLRPRIGWTLHGVAASLGRMARLAGAEGPLDGLELQGLGLAATVSVLRAAGVIADRPPSRAMTPARLRRVRAYVEENLDRPLCLAEMAGAIGLSPGHFSRAFRAEVGLSPYAWVVQVRVERVKDRLLNSRRTLAEIAVDCGFATQSHMTEVFRRATGLPPARWLRGERALVTAD